MEEEHDGLLSLPALNKMERLTDKQFMNKQQITRFLLPGGDKLCHIYNGASNVSLAEPQATV